VIPSEKELIRKTEQFVRKEALPADSGHDWEHTRRVRRLALHIHELEQEGDRLVIELAALLHDIADSKFHDGDETLGGETATRFLEGNGLDRGRIGKIREIIDHISFKHLGKKEPDRSIEFMIVQDADRLDAMGAIGIARAFSYGGYKGRKMHDPRIPVRTYKTSDEYKRSDAPTINHFHEKLLKLKDLMNTETGRAIAEERHRFMQTFLDRFLDEWG